MAANRGPKLRLGGGNRRLKSFDAFTIRNSTYDSVEV